MLWYPVVNIFFYFVIIISYYCLLIIFLLTFYVVFISYLIISYLGIILLSSVLRVILLLSHYLLISLLSCSHFHSRVNSKVRGSEIFFTLYFSSQKSFSNQKSLLLFHQPTKYSSPFISSTKHFPSLSVFFNHGIFLTSNFFNHKIFTFYFFNQKCSSTFISST